MAELAKPGDRRVLAVTFARRDDETRQGSLALEMVRDAEARGKLLVGVLTDISERLRQQRLARGEAAHIDRRVRERSASSNGQWSLGRENSDWRLGGGFPAPSSAAPWASTWPSRPAASSKPTPAWPPSTA